MIYSSSKCCKYDGKALGIAPANSFNKFLSRNKFAFGFVKGFEESYLASWNGDAAEDFFEFNGFV